MYPACVLTHAGLNFVISEMGRAALDVRTGQPVSSAGQRSTHLRVPHQRDAS
jgi:hypothetical protein